MNEKIVYKNKWIFIKKKNNFYTVDENLTIACKSHSIQISEIQRQGKNKQSSKEFLLGKKIKVGSILN